MLVINILNLHIRFRKGGLNETTSTSVGSMCRQHRWIVKPGQLTTGAVAENVPISFRTDHAAHRGRGKAISRHLPAAPVLVTVRSTVLVGCLATKRMVVASRSSKPCTSKAGKRSIPWHVHPELHSEITLLIFFKEIIVLCFQIPSLKSMNLCMVINVRQMPRIKPRRAWAKYTPRVRSTVSAGGAGESQVAMRSAVKSVFW